MKIKAFTDIQQGRKLAEILPLESADMTYFYYHWQIDINSTLGDTTDLSVGFNIKLYERYKTNTGYYCIPCWSLAALMNVIKGKLCHYNDRYYCQLIEESEDFPTYSTSEYDNPIDACVEMITKGYWKNSSFE